MGTYKQDRAAEDIKREKMELERQKKEREWRDNLTVTQRIFLKIWVFR